MTTCENCGEPVYRLGCINCDEAAYTEQQELLNDLPEEYDAPEPLFRSDDYA